MKKNKKLKIDYEPEADILRVEASSKPIEYATEVGNVVVHFGTDDKPVYVEILDATNFLTRASTTLDFSHKQKLMLAIK